MVGDFGKLRGGQVGAGRFLKSRLSIIKGEDIHSEGWDSAIHGKLQANVSVISFQLYQSIKSESGLFLFQPKQKNMSLNSLRYVRLQWPVPHGQHA